MLEDIIAHNRKFVENKEYIPFATSKYPDRKLAIVTCMDTRLTHLLPAALGINGGEVKMIKNAGGMITDPWDSTMRSVLVAVYELGVNQVAIIGHTGCGVQGMQAAEMKHLMRERGIEQSTIDLMETYSDVDLNAWLTGFEDTEDAVLKSVALVKNHPLLPADTEVAGFIINTDTGQLKSL